MVAGDPLQPHETVDAQRHHHAPGQGLQEVHLQVTVEGTFAEVGFQHDHADARPDG